MTRYIRRNGEWVSLNSLSSRMSENATPRDAATGGPMVNRGDVWFCGYCDTPVGNWTRDSEASSGVTVTRIEPCGHEWIELLPYWAEP